MIRKLFYITLICLFASVGIAADIKYYHSFESTDSPPRIVDKEIDDSLYANDACADVDLTDTGETWDCCTGADTGTCSYIDTGQLNSTVSARTGGAKQYDQTLYIRDDLTPRYGDQYLHIQATWGSPEDCGPFNGGYGLMGFERGWIQFCHTELEAATNISLDVDNGTEYWIAWSQYIPSDEKEQLSASGMFQAPSVGGSPANYNSVIQYWGSSDRFRTAVFGSTGGFNNVYAPNNAWCEAEDDPWDCCTDLDTGTCFAAGGWDTFGGEWVDWVVRAVWYEDDNAAAKTHIYFNGGLAGKGQGDGADNVSDGATGTYLVWQNYNFWHCGDEGAEAVDDDSCADTADDYYGCDNTGEWANWTRNYIIDEIRVYEYTSGQGDHYCSVAPPIWSNPSVTSPTEGSSGITTTPTIYYSAYADFRWDIQNCFAFNKSQIQIETAAGDWTSPVYDSGETTDEGSHQASGLSVDTSYKVRVRHKTIRAAETEYYWGDWSTVVNFSTGTGVQDPEFVPGSIEYDEKGVSIEYDPKGVVIE